MTARAFSLLLASLLVACAAPPPVPAPPPAPSGLRQAWVQAVAGPG